METLLLYLEAGRGTVITVIFYALFSTLMAVIIGAYLTNPFNRFTIVRHSYRVHFLKSIVETIDNNHLLIIRQSPGRKVFAVLKNGIHILNSRWHRSPISQGKTIEKIIADIYTLRFNPDKLLLTSGDHFSALFVRNLGVFYYPTLDTHIAAQEDVWHDRQKVYIQTLAYALGVFDKHDILTTTIVPTGRFAATCVNFYAYPSDTLYGMLYGLAHVTGKESGRAFDYVSNNPQQLDIVPAGETLLSTYKNSLSDHYNRYRNKVFDEALGLVDPNVRMSGAKDITKRSSAFYDNVVFWKTTELAMRLGLITSDKQFLRTLKDTILTTFWLEDKGYFLEDLSEEGKSNAYYSSDWLIVLATGFIDPAKQSEQHYFIRSIEYIRSQNIDRPFAIKYQQDTRAHRQFLAVRLAVASYGGDSIWSFWGMEYIKLHLVLFRETNNAAYLKEADYHITKYKHAMKKYGGFPEVYDANGDMLQTPLYRSVRQTGWVIGFDQVLRIRATIDA